MSAQGWNLTPGEREAIIASWPDGGASNHLVPEAQYARRCGHRPGDPPVLGPDDPVPGCTCERCTGIPDTSPKPRHPGRGLRMALDVDAARAVPVTRVAAALGLEVNARGYTRCPFHEDRTPSLHLNDRKSRAFCNVCSRSWDGIALAREVSGVSFPDAVRFCGAA